MTLITQEPELNKREWAKWKRNLLTTGIYDPNEYDTLSPYQKKWTADVLNTLKALEK